MEKKSRKKSLGIMGAKGEKKKNEEKTERSFLQKAMQFVIGGLRPFVCLVCCRRRRPDSLLEIAGRIF